MHVSAATWSELSSLLDEALDLDAPARAGWLERQAAAQPDLAPVLRRLLAAHASSETADLLARLPRLDAPLDAQRSGLAAGERVGPYRLKRELGSGGMADVWLAERADGAFEREVALKLPRVSRLRSDLALRFARERDILARLEHPHIARLYDAGVADDGLPYLAMEVVDGRPVIVYCDAQRLDIAARLRLFTQVLDAVQYAHANLVIHRDLKPSNILVTGDAQVRLLDFGIAKLLADGDSVHETQLTQLSGRALTPDYASPEQIKGESLSIASDVYSLGVVLYELLAGQRPYRLKLASAAQLEEAIVSIDPARPSGVISAPAASARASSERGLARALAGDLDTIVLKALAKTPAERYATVAAFADDLQRHLAGQPVQARPASWRYRVRKFVERNRLVVGAAAAIGIALLAAALVSLWQARLAREQAARAEAVKQFVLSFFDAAHIDRGGNRQTTAAELLRQARQRLDGAAIDDAATRIELLTTIGAGLRGLGQLEPAEAALAEATQLAHSKLGDDRLSTAEARLAYGFVLLDKGALDAAAAELEAVRKTMEQLGHSAGVSAALRGLSEVRVGEGKFDQTIELARQAVRAAERAPIDKRALLDAELNLSGKLMTLAVQGALAPARHARELARELYGERATAQWLEARRNYADALAEEGDAGDAVAEMRAVLDLESQLLGPEHVNVGLTLDAIGGLQLRQGDIAAALETVERALRIFAAASGGKPTNNQAIATLNLGTVQANAHRHDAALAQCRAAEALFSALYDADHDGARTARSCAALALTQLGRLDEADAILARELAKPFSSPMAEGVTRLRLGLLRSAQGRHEEALGLLRAGSAGFASAPPAMRRRNEAIGLARLGHGLVEAGRAAEAREALQQARERLGQDQRNGSPDLAGIAVDLARAYLALGAGAAALAAAAEAVAFWERFDARHRDNGIALAWQARALLSAGERPKAGEALQRARDILAGAALPGDRDLLGRVERELAAAVR